MYVSMQSSGHILHLKSEYRNEPRHGIHEMGRWNMMMLDILIMQWYKIGKERKGAAIMCWKMRNIWLQKGYYSPADGDRMPFLAE